MTAELVVDERVIRLIEDGERFALLTHVNADGDGLGSEMALYAFLSERGKQVRMINNDPVPANYHFLSLTPKVEVYERGSDAAQFVEEADALFVIDNGSLSRLGKLEPHVRASVAVKVCVDHHETRDDVWDLTVIDQNASASGEIIHCIIEQMGGTLTREIAEALYVSIITDTGHFRFSKTRPLTHRIAGEILATGVRPEIVYEAVYEHNTAGYLRLMGHALQGMQLDDSGRLAWTLLDREVQEQLDVIDEDTGGVINHMLSVHGVRMALLLKDSADGQVKVSLRSKGEIDVSRLAQRHGGGGHRNASGILLDGPLEKAASELVREARAMLDGES